MFTQAFLKQTAERAVKTFAQAAVAVLIGSEAVGLTGVDFVSVVSVAGLAALISVLTSIGSGVVTSDSQPSLVESPKSKGI